MVTILDEVPTFGQSFGKAVGSGIGSGINKGLDFSIKMGVKNRANLQKNRSKLIPGIKSHLSLYDKNKAFDADMIGELEQRASKYIDSGLDSHDAISQAFQEMTQEGDSGGKNNVFDQMGVTQEKKQSPWRGDPELLKKLGITSEEGFGEDIKTGLKKGIRPLVQLADFPFSLAKRIGMTPRGKTLNDYDTLTDMYDKWTNDKGKPQNIVERLTAGYPLGGAGVAAEGVQEILNTAGAPESVQEAGGILTLLLANRFKLPEANAVVKRAEKVAKETGKTTEAVLEEAQKESGVKMEDVAKGDESAIRSLKEKITEAPKGAEKVKETPKTVFNKKGAEKERRIFGEKLAESPLDEYYSIKAKEAETQANKRPETIAREKEIRTALAPEEKRLIDDLRNKREDLARIDKARKKLIGQEKARVDTLYSHRVKSIEEATDKLKDVQYQMKYGRARPSEGEIHAQIEDSVKRFKEGIENPTPDNINKLARQLELDKKYIERASKLEKRGELSGEISPDTFLRMKSKYLEGYKAAIKEAKETISALKQADDPMALSSIAKEKKLIDTLQNRIKRLEADIVNQRDNIKAMRALEKPSGAFYKQQLKNLKRDDALFRNDLFKQNKLKSPEDLKVSKTYSEKSPDVKLGKETAENPSAENLKKSSEQTGKSEEKIKEDLKKEGKEFEEAAKEITNGTVDPKTESKFLKNLKKYGKLFGAGFGVGSAQALIEEKFNIKVDSKILRYIGYVSGFGTFGGTTLGHNVVRELFDDAQAKHLKTLRGNPRAWNQYVNNMRKSNGEAKVKRVLKKANEE
jgi:hypothetical protein